jgi:hypothetical protein
MVGIGIPKDGIRPHWPCRTRVADDPMPPKESELDQRRCSHGAGYSTYIRRLETLPTVSFRGQRASPDWDGRPKLDDVLRKFLVFSGNGRSWPLVAMRTCLIHRSWRRSKG